MWNNGFRTPQLLDFLIKEHQRDALGKTLDTMLDGVHGTLIAHGMGLGKSFLTLAILEVWMARFKNARAVVACPKSMVTQWGNEVCKWQAVINIDAYTVLVGDEAIERTLKPWMKHGGVVFIGHDQFRRAREGDLLHMTKNDILVVDEAHLLKEKQTKLYKAVHDLPGMRRIFLTGSPLQNNMGEYYSMIQLLAPGVIGLTDADFARMYTRPIAQGMLKDASEAEKIECSQHIEALRYRVSRENNIVNEKSSSFLHKHIPAKFEFCVLHDCTPFVSDSSVIKERHNI